MNTFRLKITSPDGVLFSGEAESLFLRGTEGDLAVLAGHAPFVGTVKAGACRVVPDGGSERIAKTSGGLLQVSDGETILFTRSFEWTENNDRIAR